MATEYVSISSISSLQEFIKQGELANTSVLVLGGGSNILFTSDFKGLILHNQILGITKIREDDNEVDIRIGGGENWHETVINAIGNGWGGIENLSLIPGSVGAAPIQNIGAYGVEIEDTFKSLEFVHFSDGSTQEFTKEDCQFGYRDSVFKRDLKGKGMVASVTLTLSKKPSLNTSYGAIKTTLEDMSIENPTISDVSNAVIQIRRSKLPDPAEVGNAGSFFKNPVIPEHKYAELKELHRDLPGYSNGPGKIKIPAGWLIDKIGWKGYRKGSVGVHKDQALVIVHYGGGSGKEVRDLALEIKKSVYENFSIELETEVNIL